MDLPLRSNSRLCMNFLLWSGCPRARRAIAGGLAFDHFRHGLSGGKRRGERRGSTRPRIEARFGSCLGFGTPPGGSLLRGRLSSARLLPPANTSSRSVRPSASSLPASTTKSTCDGKASTSAASSKRRSDQGTSFKVGTFNYMRTQYFPPIFPNIQNVSLRLCDSKANTLIRAADIVANHIYHDCISGGKMQIKPNLHITNFP